MEKIRAKLATEDREGVRTAVGGAAGRSKSVGLAQKIAPVSTSFNKPASAENHNPNTMNQFSLTLFKTDTDAGKIGPFASKNTYSSENATKNNWSNESSPVKKSITSNDSSKANAQALVNNNGSWDVDGEEVDYTKTNLNKLTTEELEKHKKKMDVLFTKNQKKPGDPGFVYDLREEFKPLENNEWDEEL